MIYLLLSAALWLAAAQDKRGGGKWPMKKLDCSNPKVAAMPVKPCKCITEEDMCKAPMCAWDGDECSMGSKPDMPDKPDKPGRPDMPDKPDKPGRPGKPDKPDKPDMPDKPDKPGRPGGKPKKACSDLRKKTCEKSKKCMLVDNKCTEKGDDSDGGKPPKKDKCSKYAKSKRMCKKKKCYYKAMEGRKAICVSGGGDKPDKKCDETLICGEALTCFMGKMYPTTCGPKNCDKPIEGKKCGDGDKPGKKCDETLMCGQALTCFMGKVFPTTCGPKNCDEPIEGEKCTDDMEDMADKMKDEMKDKLKDKIKDKVKDKECDETLICGQALTCVMGKLFPTTCGPKNCDKPIEGETCGDDNKPDKKCDETLMCGQALSCFMGKVFPTTCGPKNCDEPIEGEKCTDDMEDMADKMKDGMKDKIKDKIKDKVKDKVKDKAKDKGKNRGRGKKKGDE